LFFFFLSNVNIFFQTPSYLLDSINKVWVMLTNAPRASVKESNVSSFVN